MTDILNSYEKLGGIFKTSPSALLQKLSGVKALIFDWDGVFNDGRKSEADSSGFSEIDSMGINMLRFSLWLKNTGGRRVPSAIITGENNPTAFAFAKRESFDAVYFHIKDKRKALTHFCASHDMKPVEIAFFLDDVLDLPLAQTVGVRFQLKRDLGIAFNKLISDKGLVDYASAHAGGQHGLREICELCMVLNQSFDEVVAKRLLFDGEYSNYIQQRTSITTMLLTIKDSEIVPAESV